MRIIQLQDGVLEVRWTWLPFWMAANPALKQLIDDELKDACLLNAVTGSEEDLDALHRYCCRRLQERFPAFPGLGRYLDALTTVQEPA